MVGAEDFILPLSGGSGPYAGEITVDGEDTLLVLCKIDDTPAPATISIYVEGGEFDKDYPSPNQAIAEARELLETEPVTSEQLEARGFQCNSQFGATMGALTITSAAGLHPMSDSEWMGFQGADGFPDGTPPLIAEGEVDHIECLFIISYSSEGKDYLVEIYSDEDVEGRVSLFNSFPSMNQAVAAVRELLKDNSTVEDLVSMGFEG
jgi:hypothetical protein